MKPMQINFARKRQPRWVLPALALIAAGLVSAWGWNALQLREQGHQLSQQIKEAKAQTEALQRQAKSSSDSAGAAALHPQYRKQAQQAAALLQADLNKAFTALENLKIPGVRLQSLNVNVAQNLVEVELEFTQLAQASEISEALGGGYATSPWQLQSTAAQTRSASPGQAAIAAYLGRWQAKLSSL
jgi:hypothetical protein